MLSEELFTQGLRQRLASRLPGAVAIDAVGPLALEARLRDGSRLAADLQDLWIAVKDARPGERGKLVDSYVASLVEPATVGA
jgi:hypothetical protein